MENEPLNWKQVLLILALLVIVWTPFTVFAILAEHEGWQFSDRQFASAGMVNLILGVGLLIFISRKWISKIK